MTQQWTEAPLVGFEALAPEPKPAIGERVHPFAALFPMMADDDLADLAADIQANGLIHSLIVDADGQLIDGRNRKAACERAGVEPRYETLAAGLNPVIFILSANVHRRHMTQGAKAMAVAHGHELTSDLSLRKAASVARVDREQVRQAALVLRWASDFVPAVMAGASLQDTYAIAAQRKQDAELQARELDRLEREHPALALQVNSGELTLTQARAMAQAQERAEKDEIEVARLRQQIALAYEEIGDAAPLPARREFTVQLTETPAPESDNKADLLRRQHEFLQRLVDLKRQVEHVARQPVLTDVSWREMELNAVRSAANQIVTAAYQMVDAHEAALGEGPRLREVK